MKKPLVMLNQSPEPMTPRWLRIGLWLLLFSLLVPVAHAERRVALIIGNGAYAESPLKNPVNDARDMRDRLQMLGFAQGDIVYRENLKTQEIGALLREWRARLGAGPDTVALVFYAGHGVQMRGENFLPTVDARILGEDDVPQHALKLADVMSVMAESRTRMNLVFLDACRNNPYARGFRDGTRGLAPERLPSGTLIAYATRPGAVAADGNGRNGIFTAHLLAHLDTPGTPVELMLKTVSDEVYALTGGRQEPWQEGSIRGFFYFQAAQAGASAVTASATQAAPAAPVMTAAPPAARPGQILKDCDICPELVVLPRGSFMMGSSLIEPGRELNEGMVHRVSIDYDLAAGRFEVTQGQWKAVMNNNPSRFQDSDQNPVENVSWHDAQLYLRRLNARTGRQYRLLSEAEWEYAARAGTSTPFHTGSTLTTQQANFDGRTSYLGSPKGVFREYTQAVGSFTPNGFGLHDMHGNVCEWVQDVWHPDYSGAPTDGSARESGTDADRNAERTYRGGSWNHAPQELRSASRAGFSPVYRYNIFGLRIARTL